MAVLELTGISKHFGAIQALIDVSLTLHAGEVVGLMGDNGAGKSTLVKIIAGNYPPSAGTMTLQGQQGRVPQAGRRARAGIEIVYQDLALCDNLSAAENVFLGRELMRGFGPLRVLDYRSDVQARRRAVRRAEVRDAAARPGAPHVGRPAPGGGDRAHAAVGPEDRADGRAHGGDQRAPGGRGAEPDPPPARPRHRGGADQPPHARRVRGGRPHRRACGAARRWPTSRSRRARRKR